MNRSEYPFNSCLSPIYQFDNKGRLQCLPCGKCAACRLASASEKTMRINAEATDCYSMFVTLTYDDVHIPHCYVELDGDNNNIVNIYDITPRFGHSMSNKELIGCSELVSDMSNFDIYFDAIKSKLNYSGFGIPYLCRRDIQLYFKRLRKLIKKEYGEEIRIYYVGEYGPQTFRPHFHFLLFFYTKEIINLFENEENKIGVSQDTVRRILPCWPWGFGSAELTRDSAASYVASYVNSTCTLPQFYQLRCTKTFGRGSNGLGEKIFNTQIQEVIKTPFVRSLSAELQLPKEIVSVAPWRSYLCKVFPKCLGFSSLDNGGREFVYTIDERFDEVYPLSRCYKVAQKAKYLMHKLWLFNTRPYDSIKHDKQFFFLYRITHLIRREFIFHHNCFTWNNVLDFSADSTQKLFQAICKLFYVSKLFIKNSRLCGISYRDYIIDIDCYYKSVAMETLKKWYELQNRFYNDSTASLFYDVIDNKVNNPFSDDFFSESKCLTTIYDKRLYFDNVRKNVLVSAYRSGVFMRYDNAQKHKKINDKNKIFLQRLYNLQNN